MTGNARKLWPELKAFLTLTMLIVSFFDAGRVLAIGVPFNVYGYIRDDRGMPLVGASVTVSSTIAGDVQHYLSGPSPAGEYHVTLQVNITGDSITVQATFGSRSGSNSQTVPLNSSSMRLDVIVPRIATSISCSASPPSVLRGQSVTISGAIFPAVVGVSVTITYTKPGGGSEIRTRTTSSGGAYSDSYTPDQLGTYQVQASWAGNNDYQGATSSPATFSARKKESSISLTLSPNAINAGTQIVISGSLSPTIGGTAVSLFYRPVTGTWITITVISTDSSSSFTYTWTNTPTEIGNYEVQAYWPGNDEYESASRIAAFEVAEPDFSLEANITSLTLVVGGTKQGINLTIRSKYGFSSSVNLALSGIPEGVIANLSTTSLALSAGGKASAFLSLYASWNSVPGDIVFRISAFGGGKNHTLDIRLVVKLPPPKFTLSIAPNYVTLPNLSGYNASVKIEVASETNYTIQPRITLRGLPPGLVSKIGEETLNMQKFGSVSAALTLIVGSVPPAKGNYTVVIECSYGGVTVTSQLEVGIIEKMPSTLTAALNSSSPQYGDEIMLSGAITPEQKAEVTIKLLNDDGTQTALASVETDDQGRFSHNMSVKFADGDYMALVFWEGSKFYLGSSTIIPMRVEKASTTITLRSNATSMTFGSTALLSGSVKDAKGRPVEDIGVIVVVSSKKATWSSILRTDKDGAYGLFVSDFSPGQYELMSHVEEQAYYKASDSEKIILSILQPVEPLITPAKITFLVIGAVIGMILGAIAATSLETIRKKR